MTAVAPWQEDPVFAGLADETDQDETGELGPADATPDPDRTTSDLSALAKDIGKVDEPIRLKVDGRPGWGVAYRTNITMDELESIYKSSRRKVKGRPAELNQIRVNRHILAVTCVGIRHQGALVVDDAGDPRTFRDTDLMDQLQVTVHAKPGERPEDTGALGCVLAFFRGRDGEISAHVDRVLRASGFGGEAEDDDDEVDPTSGA